jgi:BA14K-like protein
MQSFEKAASILLVLSLMALSCRSPALALPAKGLAGMLSTAGEVEGRSVTDVQFRRFGPYRGGYYVRRRGDGGAAAAIIGGIVIGGIIASEAARQNHYYDRAIAYCMQRFRSYDPYSRTYLGYDGYRHPCP